MTTQSEPAVLPAKPSLVARHLRFGWWSLAVFATLGVVLEALHGFKLGFYLDADQETRRLMWRLGHAHGTLLSVVHLGFAATARAWPQAAGDLASRALCGASVLMPLGFLLGGVWIHGGDPGIGVMLVPPGALLLILGAVATARRVGRTVAGD